VIRRAAMALCLFGTVGVAGAQAQDCRAISDEKERLTCYDSAAKTELTPTPTPPAEFVAPATAPYRAAWADRLQKSFLKQGRDMTVLALETKQPSDANMSPKETKLPRLAFFGCFGRPLVYRLMTEAPIMANAKKIGFRMIDLFDKCGDGHWFYDLSGPNLPKCDVHNRLCL
jgi:hypothetical protein